MIHTIIEHAVEIETRESPCCGGVYGLSKKHLTKIYKNGGEWYCPYCSRSIVYCEYEADKIKRQLESAENRLASEISRHDQTKASLKAQKAATTRIKNCVSKGVCPCCNRYFNNLHRHMENKHPNFERSSL